MDPDAIDISDVSSSELSSEWDSSDDEIVESINDLTIALQNAGISTEKDEENEQQMNSVDIQLPQEQNEMIEAMNEVDEMDENYKPVTKHEVLPENIEIESIDVTLPPNATFARAGKIVHLFEDSIIISAGREAQPIEENTLIFSEAHQCIGRVFEIFGPVTDPLYIIRWPKETPPDLPSMKLNDPLYYCNNITHYLIPSSLKCPATDASNLFDEEPNENERREIECTEDLPDGEANNADPRRLMMPSRLAPKKPEMVLNPDYSIYKNCVIPPSVPNPHPKHRKQQQPQEDDEMMDGNEVPFQPQPQPQEDPNYKTTSLSSILSSSDYSQPKTVTQDTTMELLPTIQIPSNDSEESDSDLDLEQNSQSIETSNNENPTIPPSNNPMVSVLPNFEMYMSDDDD